LPSEVVKAKVYQKTEKRKLYMSRGKKFKKTQSNEYKISNQELTDILGLSNKELVAKASSEYANWMATEKLKKEDPKLVAVSAQIKEMEEEIKQHDDYVAIKEKLEAKFEELADESLASYKEEKKNLVEPYKEDLNRFKGCFKAAMDEVNKRKLGGLLEINGKIV
jgi:hypothetical protein